MIYRQLAHSGLLADEQMALVIGAMDAQAFVRGDFGSTWNEKRIARQVLAVALFSRYCGSEPAELRMAVARFSHPGPRPSLDSCCNEAPTAEPSRCLTTIVARTGISTA